MTPHTDFLSDMGEANEENYGVNVFQQQKVEINCFWSCKN